MYVKNCWYVAGWSHDLVPDALMARVIANVPLVLYRQGRAVVAMEDRCAHRAAPLSRGRLEDGGIRCLYHGVKYSHRGDCIEVPGQTGTPRAACVRTFAAIERHSWLWVWMGDPAVADPALIPNAIGLDDEHWELVGGDIDYAAHYELLNDNLTDFSHVSYVHADSFGATEEFARTRPHVETLDRGVRIWRWLLEGYRSDSFAETRGATAAFESFETYDYLVPGVMLLHMVLCPEGTAARFSHGIPDFGQFEPITERFSCQAVTPLTERSSRYFYSSGPRRGALPAGSETDERYRRSMQAFIEDRDMIEAQQRIIDFDPQRPQVLLPTDLAPAKFRAVLRALAEKERVTSSSTNV
jgi:phenylpropionate dioxygenase-like ring-hydroxylating dioxygenase large terminal subunit